MGLIKLNTKMMDVELTNLINEYCLLNNLELEGLFFEIDSDYEGEENEELHQLIWYQLKNDTCHNATKTPNGKVHFISVTPKHKEYNLKDDEFYGFFEIPSFSSCDVFDPWRFCDFCVTKTRPNSRMAKSLKKAE